MATKAQAQRDREMAARLKREKDTRTVARCPICSKVVALNQLPVHLAYHPV